MSSCGQRGVLSVIAGIEHLEELQIIYLMGRCDEPLSDTDLIFTRYLYENCDALYKF